MIMFCTGLLLSINEMKQVGIPRIVRKKKQTAERQPDTYVPKDMAGLVRGWNVQGEQVTVDDADS